MSEMPWRLRRAGPRSFRRNHRRCLPGLYAGSGDRVPDAHNPAVGADGGMTAFLTHVIVHMVGIRLVVLVAGLCRAAARCDQRPESGTRNGREQCDRMIRPNLKPVDWLNEDQPGPRQLLFSGVGIAKRARTKGIAVRTPQRDSGGTESELCRDGAGAHSRCQSAFCSGLGFMTCQAIQIGEGPLRPLVSDRGDAE